MKWLNQAEIEAFLVRNGVCEPAAPAEILSGFDLDRPIYEQQFEEGQDLFQFIRNASASNTSPRVGNWFALPGATTGGVAIIDGGAGRRFHRFRVSRNFTALEGTAKDFPLTWKFEIGGKGGATQIYVPPALLGHLRAISAAERAY
jgi:hypothetical protein